MPIPISAHSAVRKPMTTVTTTVPVDPELQELQARKNLGKRLAAIRKSQNWTQQYLADRLGVDQATVCRWERGSKGTLPQTVLAVYALLQGCSVDELAKRVVSDQDKFVPRQRSTEESGSCLKVLTTLGMLKPDPHAPPVVSSLEVALVSSAIFMLNSPRPGGTRSSRYRAKGGKVFPFNSANDITSAINCLDGEWILVSP